MTNNDNTSYDTSSLHVDDVEVARMIRKHLKKHLPGAKFSVRLQRDTDSITIHWTDGPTKEQVDSLTFAFAGRRFASGSSCPYLAHAWYCDTHGPRVARPYESDINSYKTFGDSRCCIHAQLMHFCTSHVLTQRQLSEEFTTQLAARVREDCRMTPEGPLDEQLPEGSRWKYSIYATVQDGVQRLSRETAQP